MTNGIEVGFSPEDAFKQSHNGVFQLYPDYTCHYFKKHENYLQLQMK